MKKKSFILGFIFLLMLIVFPSNVMAAKNKWQKKGDDYYYYKADGQLAKNGVFTINGKKYCFDSKGHQLTGWRKVGKNSCYFYHRAGAEGKMATNTSISGIKLDKNGIAVPKSTRDKKKLPMLIYVRKLADSVAGTGLKSEEKLKACFNYVRKYQVYYLPKKKMSSSTWDIEYADSALKNKFGDCYSYACAFGYLAHAVGYTDATIISNGHCWVKIDGKYYDPFWANQFTFSCYGVPAKKCVKLQATKINWNTDGIWFKHCGR